MDRLFLAKSGPAAMSDLTSALGTAASRGMTAPARRQDIGSRPRRDVIAATTEIVEDEPAL
jgi:hypothetical protein